MSLTSIFMPLKVLIVYVSCFTSKRGTLYFLDISSYPQILYALFVLSPIHELSKITRLLYSCSFRYSISAETIIGDVVAPEDEGFATTRFGFIPIRELFGMIFSSSAFWRTSFVILKKSWPYVVIILLFIDFS